MNPDLKLMLPGLPLEAYYMTLIILHLPRGKRLGRPAVAPGVYGRDKRDE